MHHAWWRQILTGKDALRHRLAVALSEIFVVSEVANEGIPWETMEYYDDLGVHAFGNWRDLLHAVTLDPIMGYYLTYLRNRKADPAVHRYPDENYAREVMQLFSIGLWELNQDGTRKRDWRGREIPTYDNRAVTAFARVFTGLSFGGPLATEDRPDDFFNVPPNFSAPMKMWEEHHDREAKLLLRGKKLPAFAKARGRKGLDDVRDAVDNLFQHPNVGPFFGRLLIQRLVTSNPSPAYIGRVSAVFAKNSRGERGDMKALIRAILLDPEARSPQAGHPTAGKLREPYLRYVALARTFEAKAESGAFRVNDHDTHFATNQILLNSPSVFNFFLPDYQPPGAIAEAGLFSPEFQIVTSTTAITALNHFSQMVGAGFGDSLEGPDQMRLNFAHELKLIDRPDALIDALSLKLTGGRITRGTRQILLTALGEMPATFSAEDRVRTLVQLMALSPDFAVE